MCVCVCMYMYIYIYPYLSLYTNRVNPNLVCVGHALRLDQAALRQLCVYIRKIHTCARARTHTQTYTHANIHTGVI